jgi:hypothetical protein
MSDYQICMKTLIISTINEAKFLNYANPAEISGLEIFLPTLDAKFGYSCSFPLNYRSFYLNKLFKAMPEPHLGALSECLCKP